MICLLKNMDVSVTVMSRCRSCRMYTYPALKRCNSCGLPTHLSEMYDYDSNPKQISTTAFNNIKIPMIKFEETNIDKQLSKIYTQPNERFLNPVGHYKGVKNSEAKTQ